MRFVSLMAVLALSACAPSAQVSKARPTAATEVSFAPLQGFAPQGSSRSNAEIARDFLDLSFAMESGRSLSILTRFEGPISIRLSGSVPPTAPRDLAVLIARLQSEASLPITASFDDDASITVEFVPRAALRQLAPQAACFVVPNVSSLAEYRSRRGSDEVDWGAVTRRTRAAIFVPADTSPQEVRDCLHEEIAQAIGPLNDLYRLPDSVFNDDNFNSVLTAFDMLILRIYYAPELQGGMTRNTAAALVPGLVARLNPAGAGMGSASAGPTPRAWTTAIETALGRKGSTTARLKAAERAVSLARSEGWDDNRLAFSYFALGRLSAGSDQTRALGAFSAAAAIYVRQPGGEVHVAHIEMQLAAMALGTGSPTEAIRLADHAMPIAQRHENAALLATLMLIKAEAMDRLGDTVGAAALRLDSQPWARYGFGSDTVVKARMRDIAAVASGGGKG